MANQSVQSRLGSLLLPFFSSQVFPDEWMDAGNDRVVLGRVAARRRRTDGPRPDQVLRRRWAITTTNLGGRDLHILTPRGGSTGRLLFYCHGGAYVFGPNAIEWLTAASLARKLAVDLALYDYPKAPEFDAEDTLPAIQEAWAEATGGHDPADVIIAGTSAGGGLAASVLLHLAATGAPLPAGAVLVSPWLDLASTHPEAERFDRTDLLLPIESLRRDGEIYAGRRDITDPLVSPYYADDAALATLPPMVITVGENELFAPEGRDFAGRINAGGGSARLLVEPFGQHATGLLPIPETADIRTEIVDTCRSWLGSATA